MECLDNRDEDRKGRRYLDEHPTPCPALIAFKDEVKALKLETMAEKVKEIDPKKISMLAIVNIVLLIFIGIAVTLVLFKEADLKSDKATILKKQDEIKDEWATFKVEITDQVARKDEGNDTQMRLLTSAISSMDKQLSVFIETSKILIEQNKLRLNKIESDRFGSNRSNINVKEYEP